MIFRIREAREKAGLTQAQMSKMLGLNDVTLSGYELGKHDPKSNTLVKIAQICGTSVDYLLGLEDTPPVAENSKSQSMDEDDLLTAYHKLNSEGRRMALGMVESLALNPAYLKDTSRSAG